MSARRDGVAGRFRSRKDLRRALVALVTLALGGLSLGAWHVARRSTAPVERVRPIDGLHVENVRHVRYVEGEPVLRITVGQGSLRRPRVGIFRIGFARSLVASDVAIEATVGDGRVRGVPTQEIGSAFAELFQIGSGRAPTVTSVDIDGITLALRGREGRMFELRADSCSGGLSTGGSLVLHGVSVKSARRAFDFATLELDVASGSFVAATPFAGIHVGRDAEPPTQVLRALNCDLEAALSLRDHADCSEPDARSAGARTQREKA